MKKLLLLFVFLPLLSYSQDKGFYVEPFVGIGKSGFIGNDVREFPHPMFYYAEQQRYDNNLTVDKHPDTYTALGVNIGYYIPRFNLGTGAYYATYNILETYHAETNEDIEYSKSLSYIRIPLSIGTDIKLTDKIYLSGGIQANVGVLTKEVSGENSVALNSVHINAGHNGGSFDNRHSQSVIGTGVNIGLGYEMGKFYPVARFFYNRDFTDAENKQSAYSYPTNPMPIFNPLRSPQYNYAYGVSLGVRYKLGE